MIDWSSATPSVLASFMASTVEFVEALTIVLAVGAVRGWRSAILGAVGALLALAALVALLGPSLTRVPLPTAQLVVGTLLLLFGLRWLRKAILRSAGVLALHDEARAYAQETQALRGQGVVAPQALEPLAFAASFKIVMLEGIEVVFIVVAIGAGGRMLWPASIGALLALGMVVALGLWLHSPLARVPENTLKFGVGVMLAAFGTFWVGEGIGLVWPRADWAVLGLIGAYLGVALLLVPAGARLREHPRPSATSAAAVATVTSAEGANPAAGAPSPPGRLARIGKELVGLFIDDGWLAGGIVSWVVLAWRVESRRGVASAASLDAAALFTAGLALLLAASALRRARQ